MVAPPVSVASMVTLSGIARISGVGEGSSPSGVVSVVSPTGFTSGSGGSGLETIIVVQSPQLFSVLLSVTG